MQIHKALSSLLLLKEMIWKFNTLYHTVLSCYLQYCHTLSRLCILLTPELYLWMYSNGLYKTIWKDLFEGMKMHAITVCKQHSMVSSEDSALPAWYSVTITQWHWQLHPFPLGVTLSSGTVSWHSSNTQLGDSITQQLCKKWEDLLDNGVISKSFLLFQWCEDITMDLHII